MAKAEREESTITLAVLKRHLKQNIKSIKNLQSLASKNPTVKKSMTEMVAALEDENEKLENAAINCVKKDFDQIRKEG